MTRPLRLVFCGLTLSSSWGNGHATTYRALIQALHERGHDVTFLERDQPWYAEHRDLVTPSYCRLVLYRDLPAFEDWREQIAAADAVVVGSFVPEGVAVGAFVQRHARLCAFYDIDTPVTLAGLARGACAYLAPEQIPRYHLYLSFTGGPTLRRLQHEHGAPLARPLYCSVDSEAYQPRKLPRRFALAYLGTYSADRQPTLERFLIEPARRRPDLRFAVAGAQFPDVEWPANVTRYDHIEPAEHSAFYSGCRFTLNVTRSDMIAAGHSPSVRLFEAAACACPIISDEWPGLDALFAPRSEILIARRTYDVLTALDLTPQQARRIGEAARRRILAEHTARHRAVQLEHYLLSAIGHR